MLMDECQSIIISEQSKFMGITSLASVGFMWMNIVRVKPEKMGAHLQEIKTQLVALSNKLDQYLAVSEVHNKQIV